MLAMSSLKVTAALALTGVAGYVDAMGYVALLHVYTANMSGNSIALGMDVVRGEWRGATFRALPVLTFFAGLMIASVIIEIAKLRGVRRRVSIALAVELVCLLSVVRLAPTVAVTRVTATQALVVALSAVAMGAQNASLRDAGVLDVYTTHVTGTLTTLAREASRFIVGRRIKTAHLLLLAGLWVLYVVGAAAGRWGRCTAGCA